MSVRKRRKGPEQREQPVPVGLGGDQVPVLAESDLSDDAQVALKEMIDEYDRGMEDERRFRDRATAADRTGSTARPRLRYVRAAAAAETSQRPSH
jgi:hypothetical protein